ncbi:hypothetical protein [Gracilibacillus timonensis]|uniref:hypothetical protein n=1 Tax=Gracilibacillus timonensis TaxID=1816696 RepID=UPI000825159B|nr:hypothetical protein [Gracilibacillus timonensis]
MKSSVKRYLMTTMAAFTVLIIAFFINYQNNAASIFAIENVSLFIAIIGMIILTSLYISIKIYEKRISKK